jgi:hypothetical protein
VIGAEQSLWRRVLLRRALPASRSVRQADSPRRTVDKAQIDSEYAGISADRARFRENILAAMDFA